MTGDRQMGLITLDGATLHRVGHATALAEALIKGLEADGFVIIHKTELEALRKAAGIKSVKSRLGAKKPDPRLCAPLTAGDES